MFSRFPVFLCTLNIFPDIGNGGYEPLYAQTGAPGPAAPSYGAATVGPRSGI